METTGVVKRIDDLGRIVIPKEIRRTLGIKDGSSLEIYIDNDMLALKKHSTMNNLVEIANVYTETIYTAKKINVIITDRDTIISCPKYLKKKYLNKQISKELEEILLNVNNNKEGNTLKLSDEIVLDYNYLISKITANGDAIGLLILISKDKITELERNIADIASQFLGKNIEE